MKFNKNEKIVVCIEDIGSSGEGIGKIEGYPIFIKDAIIGDQIEAKITKTKKNYAYARLEKVLQPSPFRVTPKCEFHKQCGGCQIQAMDYQKQLEFKQSKVRNNLIRIGKFDEKKIDAVMEPIVGMKSPYYYRNKAQFPFGLDKDGNIVTGFYAGRTHCIIPNTDCALGVPENQLILEKILNFLKKKNISIYQEETGKGLLRHVLIRVGFTTKEIMVCFVVNGKSIPDYEEIVEQLLVIPGMTSIMMNVQTKNTNVIMGEECKLLWGQDYITDYIGEIAFQISPLSFYQVNPIQTKELYLTALEYAGLTGEEVVWDLYCGIGTISLFLTQKAKQVYGVEIVPQAIEDAKKNAILNNIKNVEFFVGKAEEILPQKYEEQGISADVIVVDPPRKGCDEICLETMLKMEPKRIVYVSCDSATLARDLEILCREKYKIERIRAVDQFCHTTHVETCVLLSHKNS